MSECATSQLPSPVILERARTELARRARLKDLCISSQLPVCSGAVNGNFHVRSWRPASAGVFRLGHAPSLNMTVAIGWRAQLQPPVAAPPTSVILSAAARFGRESGHAVQGPCVWEKRNHRLKEFSFYPHCPPTTRHSALLVPLSPSCFSVNRHLARLNFPASPDPDVET
jgi:hypothetical protein